MNIDPAEYFKKAVTRDVATLFVDESDEKRYLIGEVLLGSAALFLINRYFVGVAKGLGIEELGIRHGKAAKEWLARLQSVQSVEAEYNKYCAELAAEVERMAPLSAAATEAGKAAVVETIVEAGGSKSQARQQAEKIHETVAGLHG